MREKLFMRQPYQVAPEFESILTMESEFESSTASDTAFPANTSRNSVAYIKWVQSSLNKILGLRLEIDGIRGPLTRSAIRSFQKQKNLTVDGIVGPITEAAIKLALAGMVVPPTPLTVEEQTALSALGPLGIFEFQRLRSIVLGYTGVALREGDRGLRVLLKRGVFKALPALLPGITEIANMTSLSPGWSITMAKPLLVGNILYNLAFPETINQGNVDPTCFSACTQMLLARRYPVTYVRYVKQLATYSTCTYASGDRVGPLTFVSTSVYKSLDSVLLQTAFNDSYTVQVSKGRTYQAGDELIVHRQVFGSTRPPKFSTSGANVISAFRKGFVTNGGNTKTWELINLTVSAPNTWSGHHSVVITRVLNGRVFFYNPWPNETERNQMFGSGKVTVSGNGERPAEASMTQQDFEGQLLIVFHN